MSAGSAAFLLSGVLLGLSVVAALAPRSRLNPQRLALSLAALGCLAILALGLIVVASGNPVSAQVGDVLGFSLVAVRYDQLSGLFLIALGAVGVASSIFGIGYTRSTTAGDGPLAAAYPVFLGSLALVFGADEPSLSCSRGS